MNTKFPRFLLGLNLCSKTKPSCWKVVRINSDSVFLEDPTSEKSFRVFALTNYRISYDQKVSLESILKKLTTVVFLSDLDDYGAYYPELSTEIKVFSTTRSSVIDALERYVLTNLTLREVIELLNSNLSSYD